MKRTLTTLTLAAIMMFASTFAHAGILIGDRAAPSCSKDEAGSDTSLVKTVLAMIDGILIGDRTGILIGDNQQEPCTDGILIGDRTEGILIGD